MTQASEFVRLPVLLSHNSNEAGYYRIAAYSNGVVPTDAQVDAFYLESFVCLVSLQTLGRGAHGVLIWDISIRVR